MKKWLRYYPFFILNVVLIAGSATLSPQFDRGKKLDTERVIYQTYSIKKSTEPEFSPEKIKMIVGRTETTVRIR